MATKSTTKSKGRKPKQPIFEEFRDKPISEIDYAATAYTDARDERLAKLAEEKAYKEVLLEIMRKHKLDCYELADGSIVSVATDYDVKVSKQKASESANGDGDGKDGDE